MDFVQYAAYALAASGALFLVMCANVSAHTTFNRLLFKVLPVLLGATCLWFSAIILVQV